ncbi:aminoglycoside phosphotransferase family protein [Ferrimonas kyonanensis]|uniref:aminoglycoside phosphotransferase family protein n=1 Tax=Ferrimonas kyonanensis TaxID=364763 RepID=UPI000688C633|nr:phosphotransferase [Ferrimonas kyonanensis]
MQDSRRDQLQGWLNQCFSPSIQDLVLIFGDASYRRYFRFSHQGHSYIAVDAPPDKENSAPFVAMTRAYHQAGLPAPEIVHSNLKLGFMCQSDLGDDHLQRYLSASTLANWYSEALSLLPQIGAITATEDGPLPAYDEALLRQELSLLPQWFLKIHLGQEPNRDFDALWSPLCDLLVDNALSQPQVGVHRDYHCRNLMVVDQHLAIIDYQGAVLGPVTYDPVSLLKDCYVRWAPEQLTPLLDGHYQRLSALGWLGGADRAQFQRWYDLTGLQRHLKVLGIFARLCHRDGKPGYLADLPRVLEYVIEAADGYADTRPLAQLARQWRQQLEVPA